MRRVKILAGDMLILLVLATLAGCTTNPIKEAQSLEAKADAVYGEYVSAEKRMVDIIHNEQVPQSIKAELKVLHDMANPWAERLDTAKENVANLQVSHTEDLPGAIRALDDILRQSEPFLNDFKARVDKENR
jgi:hypothetical protein